MGRIRHLILFLAFSLVLQGRTQTITEEGAIDALCRWAVAKPETADLLVKAIMSGQTIEPYTLEPRERSRLSELEFIPAPGIAALKGRDMNTPFALAAKKQTIRIARELLQQQWLPKSPESPFVAADHLPSRIFTPEIELARVIGQWQSGPYSIGITCDLKMFHLTVSEKELGGDKDADLDTQIGNLLFKSPRSKDDEDAAGPLHLNLIYTWEEGRLFVAKAILYSGEKQQDNDKARMAPWQQEVSIIWSEGFLSVSLGAWDDEGWTLSPNVRAPRHF